MFIYHFKIVIILYICKNEKNLNINYTLEFKKKLEF